MKYKIINIQKKYKIHENISPIFYCKINNEYELCDTDGK